MSVTDTRLTLAHAESIALDLAELLRPSCLTIAIAGSIRRRRPLVKDIELLAIPQTISAPINLFGDVHQVRDLLDEEVRAWLEAGTVQPRLDVNGRQAIGTRYKRLLFRDVPVDLFTAQSDNWGVQLAIRTGPAEFSKRLVSRTIQGGLLPFGYWVGKEGGDPAKPSHLWCGTAVIPTPTEEELFAAIGLEWIRPEERG